MPLAMETSIMTSTLALNDVRSLVAVLEEMGNPFLEDSEDLLVIDTRDVMDAAVATL